MKLHFLSSTSALASALLVSCSAEKPALEYDLIIRNGTLYDGSGNPPFVGDLAILGDEIAAMGNLKNSTAKSEIDAKGLAVAPGFINTLSWAAERLIYDGRGQSDLRQGVTLNVFGEGESMGPLNDSMKKEMAEEQGDIKYDIEWTTLGEFLSYLERRGVSCNVASFVGAATVRQHEIGQENREPTPQELERMRQLVARAMEEGALGVSTALIYAPGIYAKTDEIVELARVAAKYGGLYTSHLRSEGNRFLEALDELLTVAREANIRAQVYHLKAAGAPNWPKLDDAIKKIEDARAAGLKITADMYLYTAGATGLDAMMPPWVREGGLAKWAERLQDPAVRQRLVQEISTPSDEWENFYLAAGSPEKIILVGFKNDALKPLTGNTLAEVAQLRGTSPIETAMDLVVEDGSRVGAVYFLMSEENVRKEVKLPWVSFCSDAGAYTTEGLFLKSNPHPRAYGNFARLLGKYVREEKLIPLEAAIHRLTTFPAQTFRLSQRGALRPGYYADVVIFDPEKIIDHATFEKPHQYATGVHHVFVNGVQVIKDGNHTGAKPGRFVRGPGWKK